MALVTLAQAKAHLRIPADIQDEDGDLYLKLTQAQDAIVDYLKAQADPLWDETTVPLRVSASVVMVLEDLYERRPIDWRRIELLLARSRDPALA